MMCSTIGSGSKGTDLAANGSLEQSRVMARRQSQITLSLASMASLSFRDRSSVGTSSICAGKRRERVTASVGKHRGAASRWTDLHGGRGRGELADEEVEVEGPHNGF